MKPCRPNETDEIHITPICMRCGEVIRNCIIYPPVLGEDNYRISGICCGLGSCVYISSMEANPSLEFRIEFFGRNDLREFKVTSKIRYACQDIASLIWDNRDV